MSIYLVDYENVNSEGIKDVVRLGSDDTVIVFYTVNADKMTFELHNALNESAADISFLKVESGGKNALDFQLSTYMGYLSAQNKDERFFIVSKDTGFNYVVNFWKERQLRIQRIPSLVNAPKSPELRSSQKPSQLMLSPPQRAGEIPAAAVSKSEETPFDDNVSQTAQTQKADTQKTDTQKPDTQAADTQKPDTQKSAAKAADTPKAAKQPKRNGSADAASNETAKADEALPNDTADGGDTLPDLSELIKDKTECSFVRSAISKYKTKQGINNAMQKKFGNTRTSEIYKLIQPYIKDKKGR